MKSLYINSILADLSFPSGSSSYGSRGFGFSPWIIVLLVLLAVFWVVLFKWKKIVKQIKSPKQEKNSLFGDLSKAHELSMSEKSALKKIAQHCGFAEPAYVFVDSGWMDKIPASEADLRLSGKQLNAKLFG